MGRDLKLLETIARVAVLCELLRVSYRLGKFVAKAEVASEVHKMCKKYDIYVEEKES